MHRRPPRSTPFPYTTLFRSGRGGRLDDGSHERVELGLDVGARRHGGVDDLLQGLLERAGGVGEPRDRKSTRLNSSLITISYAVFCLKKKKNHSQSLCSSIHT